MTACCALLQICRKAGFICKRFCNTTAKLSICALNNLIGVVISRFNPSQLIPNQTCRPNADGAVGAVKSMEMPAIGLKSKINHLGNR
jgi:hypothetical protein